jgi:hypothetical protein
VTATMAETRESQQARRKVIRQKAKAAVAMDKHFTAWTAEFTPDEAQAFVARCQVYNNMTHEKLVRLVRAINRIIPAMDLGETNPNTGTPCHCFKIGNEGSRVIYVQVRKWAVPEKRGQWKRLAEQVRQFASEAGANEFHVSKNDRHELLLRIWWD